MRLLPFVAVASAFVVPDEQTFRQLALEEDSHHAVSSWRDRIPTKQSIISVFEEAIDSLASTVDKGLNTAEEWLQAELDQVEFLDNEDALEDWDEPPHHPPPHGGPPHDGPPHHGPPHRGPPHHHHGHHVSNLTIYQLIAGNKHTTKFAEFVNEHDDLVQLLNSTKANYTLFVPVDAAFEHKNAPPHHEPLVGKEPPSKEFVNSVLRYHIGLGLYSSTPDLLATHTVPTALDEELLDGNPQRLRTRFGLGGVRVNFFTKIIVGNFVNNSLLLCSSPNTPLELANMHLAQGAKNGVIHAVDHILLPPTFAGRELSFLPSQFSTLLLAYEKTDFVKFIHGQTLHGSTLFAPTNGAFAHLGPAANAFLFNHPKGLRFLHALLKYQIVPNATLYSDAFYPDKSGDDDDSIKETAHPERKHFDLPTLLGDAAIAVDIVHFGPFTRARVNHRVPVVVQDVVAKNGVIQVTGRVPIPPRKHHKGGETEYADDGEIDVEDLKERLADYLDEDEEVDEISDL